jgi:hypothetical protein
MWRGRARGQITVETVKGAGTAYCLEVEREGKRSLRITDTAMAGVTQHTISRCDWIDSYVKKGESR